MTSSRQFFGKFRGKVADNIDPLSKCRLLVAVPVVTDAALNWALPCLPYSEQGIGFGAIPPIGANVWVEFEQGDLAYPIWSGCF